MAYQDSERPHWSFDRRISVGHLFTTISVIGSALFWGMSVEKRFSATEVELAAQRNTLASQVAAANRDRDGIIAELKTLNEQVKVLVENAAYERGRSDASLSGQAKK